MAASAPAHQTTMKAIVRERYGPPDVLELRDVEIPTIDDDSILVRVRAAAVNAYDWHMMRGRPSLVRVVAGLRKPKSSAMGIDVAGQVEAVGKNVTQFSPRRRGLRLAQRLPCRVRARHVAELPRAEAGAADIRTGRGRPHGRNNRSPRSSR